MADIKRFEEYGNRVADDYVAGLVSVITPVYNAEKYLKQSIESVLAQTYPHIEMILVDDCSKDNSADIIRKYQQNYPQIKYYLQPQNMGAGYARNKALELAQGQYVAFLDADDVWRPEKIACQIKLMEEKKSPFSYTAIEMIDEDGKLVKSKRDVVESIDYHFLLSNTMIATSTVLIDRMSLGDFRMHLRRGGQDYATWLRLLRNGCNAVGINEVLNMYRVGHNSLSSNKLDSVRQIWEIQTKDEGIKRVIVLFHIMKWCYNSIKKYWL
ncbi:putative glycosyl transferase family 2 protein [Selenomonas ruminantium subsp. lactilytica TAM6421]|uniref:Putative glycosyl transferase family 2 protein n=1 Tax=Selenomonas ruminantium subsp. lactilytica (strain NBRC 103574 / TAM6421) TaxID=927704 RepID=I0GRQ6_SELRL|nr:glycosyltransferase family 2 protein [Selenomonas ruminantium]BAL83443.1 putative glycosyl transferase family 2 protein [Selenomonas ruminantium subsp. lactilytica TAM6421]